MKVVWILALALVAALAAVLGSFPGLTLGVQETLGAAERESERSHWELAFDKALAAMDARVEAVTSQQVEIRLAADRAAKDVTEQEARLGRHRAAVQAMVRDLRGAHPDATDLHVAGLTFSTYPAARAQLKRLIAEETTVAERLSDLQRRSAAVREGQREHQRGLDQLRGEVRRYHEEKAELRTARDLASVRRQTEVLLAVEARATDGVTLSRLRRLRDVVLEDAARDDRYADVLRERRRLDGEDLPADRLVEKLGLVAADDALEARLNGLLTPASSGDVPR